MHHYDPNTIIVHRAKGISDLTKILHHDTSHLLWRKIWVGVRHSIFPKDTSVFSIGVFEYHEGQEITIEDDPHHR